MSAPDVAVLFARKDSIYKTIPGCDVYDIERDAQTFAGGMPVVAHPPCRAWGKLWYFAKPAPGEKELGIWAVDQVRRYGGVLEHPRNSLLWRECELPYPGDIDIYGGWTMPIQQWWFGHRAEKWTWLYIVDCLPAQIPTFELRLGPASHVIAPSARMRRKDGNRLHKGMSGWRPGVSKAEREHTPEKLAHWLVKLARSTTLCPATSVSYTGAFA